MASIAELLARAAALRDETALNSISPERAGGIMYDTLVAMNELWLQQGAALVISKIYASVEAMEADTAPVSDLTGQALRPGQIVVIASSDEDNGSVYRYDGPADPSWSAVGNIGAVPVVDDLTSDSSILALAARQGKVLDEKISELGQYIDNPEFKKIVAGADGAIWYAVKENGEFYFGAGCPYQVRNYIQKVAGRLIDGQDNIFTFLDGLESGDSTLTELLAEKVDKEDGESLINEDFASAVSAQEDREWLELTVDEERKILEGLKKDGSRHIFNRVVIKGVSNDVNNIKEWVRLLTDRNGNIVFGIRDDSSVVIPKLKYSGLEKLKADVFRLSANQYPPIYKHGPIVAFVDDDSGQYVPEIWNEIMERTGIRFGIACITGMMGGSVTPTRPQDVQMTLAELQFFYDNGCEVYSHSWSHHSFSGDISLELLEDECLKSKIWLDANGFLRNSNTIVYPGGMQNLVEEKTTIVRRNYEFGVATTDSSRGVNKEPIDKLHISRCNADSNTLEYLKGCVDTAVNEKKLLVVMTHAYELMGLGTTSLSPDKDVNIQRIVDMINYAKQQGAIILPLCEALHQIYGW